MCAQKIKNIILYKIPTIKRLKYYSKSSLIVGNIN